MGEGEGMAKSEMMEWVKPLLIAVVIVLAVRIFLFTPVVVKGSSMEPTLHDKERMIVWKIGEPERFDIIVFHSPIEGKDLVKRVIGLPGDHIAYKDDVLYINGEPYEEDYLDEYKSQVTDGPLTEPFTLEQTPVASAVVPEGHVFVLGDNRRDSQDSRDLGAIPIEDVVGKSKLIYFPIKDIKFIKDHDE